MKMAANNAVLNRLEQKGAEADQIIEYLKQQVALLKEKAILQASLREEKKLRVENAKLKKEIEVLKQELIQAEIRNGVKQVSVPPSDLASAVSFSKDLSQTSSAAEALTDPKQQVKGPSEEKKKKDKTEKKGEKKEKKQSAANDDSKPLDVSRLDLRIGCIMTAKKHPDADSLYIEEVDVGEANLRTVVSGLVKHVPLEELMAQEGPGMGVQSLFAQETESEFKPRENTDAKALVTKQHAMQNRMAVFLCNLKPVKMRGVVSQGMLMCASTPEKVEIIIPPNGVVPGEKITFEGFSGEPEKELNPKKKIWEQIQPDLQTNDQCIATYKGVPFEVKGKGVCRAPSMANSGIK